MKYKYLLILLLCLFIIPFTVKADEDKLYTTITGTNKIVNGQRIQYTVILDNKLTSYEATIKYDRKKLNLVSVDEIKIDSANKTFDVNKNKEVNIKINSEEPSIIVYTITFDVKQMAKLDDTTFSIKTNSAKCVENGKTYDYAAIDTDYRLITNEEGIQLKDEKKSNNSELDKIINNIKDLFNDNNNAIVIGSIILNIILFIALICSIRRKKMDYDF